MHIPDVVHYKMCKHTIIIKPCFYTNLIWHRGRTERHTSHTISGDKCLTKNSNVEVLQFFSYLRVDLKTTREVNRNNPNFTTVLLLCGGVWGVDRSGQEWTGVDMGGQEWTGVDRSGQGWTGVDRSGQEWT